MIISDIERISDGVKDSLQATITWEQADIAPDTYYFTVDTRHAELLGNPEDAFLCGSILPAFVQGEERVKVEGEVCPQLADNLHEALFWIAAWNPEYRRDRPISIEAGYRSKVIRTEGSALFYSGGVDAAFSLAHNRDTIPRGHPASVTKLILIHGFDIGGKKKEIGSQSANDAFRKAAEGAEVVAGEYAAELVVLKTNIRHLDDRSGIWGKVYVAAALGACAHALGNAASLFYLASAGEPLGETGDMAHYGTHALLDHCYSGWGVQIKHYLVSHDSRMERLRVVSAHPVLFNALRVCFNPPDDQLNCQKCEKCVRTRLQLDIIGKLEECGSLDSNLQEEELRRVVIDSDSVCNMYREMLGQMVNIRHPYTELVKRKISQYEIYKKWKEGKTWKRRLLTYAKSTIYR